MSIPANTPYTIRARWVFPVDRPPFSDGYITIVNGQIVSLDEKLTRQPDVDLGDAAVLPGLVNAHTHLDLSGLRGQLPPGRNFTDWLRGVIAHRRQDTPERTLSDIQTGLDECLSTGTTLVGDISAQGLSGSVLEKAPVWGVVFYELLGLQAPSNETIRPATRWSLERLPDETNCNRGMSPHAPYSVRHNLFYLVSVLAKCWPFPVAVHLGESLDELLLIHERRGAFVPFLEELGVWDPDALGVSVAAIIETLSPIPNVLLIHGNYLSSDITIHPGQTIVYCPRTHAAFGHRPHPFRDFLARGVRVALGTDSLASNPDLDMLAEARFLHRHHPDVPGDVLLRMATLAGAEALGFAKKTGSLTAGKSADLIVIPIDPRRPTDPHELVWQSDEKVQGVMWRGRWVKEPRP